MNVFEMVVIISVVINVLLLFLVYNAHNKILANSIHTQNILSGIGTVLTRLVVLEHTTQKLSSAFTDFVDATGNLVDKLDMMSGSDGFGVYRTMDGKYTARSIEELINKIRKDNNESSYFNEEELDKLRSMFDDDSDEEEE